MVELFKWLSTTPLATSSFIILVSTIILSFLMVFIIAFFQGREISFWPPKIGQKPQKTNINKSGKSSDSSKNIRLAQMSETANNFGAKDFFVKRILSQKLEERLSIAKTLAINGISLSRTSDSYWHIFKERIDSGAQLRILMVDPDHQAIEFAGNRFHKQSDIESVKREVFHALDNFKSLKSKISNKELFQLRLLQFPPAYGIFLIDSETPNAEIWVELYSFRDVEPSFHLLPNKDGEWFLFFQRQFEAMWNEGKKA